MRLKIGLLLTCLFLLVVSCQTEVEKEVSILKYVNHPALDELESAYISLLDSLIQTNGDDFTIKKYNANANVASANGIAKSFMKKQPDLILTIATPAAIAVSKNTEDIPHIYGAVADPKGAGIIPSERSTGIQNAGEKIIKDALILIKKAFGKDVRLGTIYNPQEQNSIFIQNTLKKLCDELDISLKQVTVQGTSNLNGLTNSLCKEVDVIYSANDNTVNSGVTSITSVTHEYKIPFIIGDLSTLKKGALFAVGLEYHSMGLELAKMSYSILSDESKTIKSFPPQSAPNPEVWFNQEAAKIIGYTLPDSLQRRFKVKLK